MAQHSDIRVGDTVIWHGGDRVDYPAIVTSKRGVGVDADYMLTVFLIRKVDWIWSYEGTFVGQFSQREEEKQRTVFSGRDGDSEGGKDDAGPATRT